MSKVNAKLLVTSDLHLGKRIGDYSLEKDQKHALKQIQTMAIENKVDAVVIAGDIYDRGGKTPEWVIPVFDEFFTTLSREGIKVLAVTGNHDSEERMLYGAQLLKNQGVHIVSLYTNAKIEPVVLGKDNNIRIYLVPCVRPGDVDYVINGDRTEGEDDSKRINNFPDAMAALINGLELDEEKINIMVTHQLIVEDGSENFYDANKSGTLSPIPVSIFESLDMVLAGHIHRRKNVGKGKVHYPGSLLKYKINDEGTRCVSLITIEDKENITVEPLEINVLHDVRVETGTLAELKQMQPTEDYVELHLLDENFINDVADQLRAVFPNQLDVRFVKLQGRDGMEDEVLGLDIAEKSILDIVNDFFKMVGGGRELGEEELECLKEYIAEVEKEDEGMDN